MRYVIITPVRNEEQFLPLTLASVIGQTVRPAQWVIVDDGSEDATAQVVRQHAEDHPWITLVMLPNRGYRQRGPGVVRAFSAGLERLDCVYDLIVKLDGDLSFEHGYFEQMMQRFVADPELGIAGGVCCVEKRGQWIPERTPEDHVRGATKVYRRSCFEDIGGLDPVGGWDAIDELRAEMRGWKVRSFRDLVVQHHRPTGGADGALSSMQKMGAFSYYRGYHPLAILLRSAYRAFRERPVLLGGLAMVWGYSRCWLSRQSQLDDPEVVAFCRKQSLRRLAFWRQ